MRKDHGRGSDSQCRGPRKGSMKQRDCLFFFKPMRLENTLGPNKCFAKNQMNHGTQTRSQASFRHGPLAPSFQTEGDSSPRCHLPSPRLERKQSLGNCVGGGCALRDGRWAGREPSLLSGLLPEHGRGFPGLLCLPWDLTVESCLGGIHSGCHPGRLISGPVVRRR